LYKVGIDLVGPLQENMVGTCHIIICIDYGMEARTPPDKTPEHAAEFLYTDIVCRHGCPAEVVSDQGEFQGAFQDLLDKLYIDHCLSSPYHPGANVLTERFDQTLTQSLTKMTQESPEEWDVDLPTGSLGCRATILIRPLHDTHLSTFYIRQNNPAKPEACKVACSIGQV